MLIIVNPYASTVSDGLRHLVVHALQGRFEVDAVDTEARGHATELCREAAHEGYDVVVAFGGDGTVNEAANGLLGSPTPLTCLPGGSANVFGKMLGIPGELIDATEHLLGMADDWRVHKVDLGVVNGRCFTFASGLGLDASVVQRVDANPQRKARWGPWFFTLGRRRHVHPALPACAPRASPPTSAARSTPASRRSCRTAPPSPTSSNRPIEIADDAKLDSGTLSACVLHRARPLDMPFIAWRAFSKHARLSHHRQITALTPTTELTVRSADDRAATPAGRRRLPRRGAEAHYSIMPRALNVVA